MDLSDRDSSIKPGDDFYMWQNGAWYARTEFSPQRPYAAYWNDLRRMVPRRLTAILTEVSAHRDAAPDSVEGRAGAFFRAFMDEKAVESKGVTPLEPQLALIRAAKSKPQMAQLMGVIAGSWAARNSTLSNQPTDRALFAAGVGQDRSDPGRYAVYLGQAGLGMPGPEYYSDRNLADIKAAYQIYVTRMLTLTAWPDAEIRAQEVVALETRIAAASWSHEQMGDVLARNNAMTVAELAALAPAFPWREFLNGAGLGKVSRVVIDAKSAFPNLARIFADTPIEVLQAQQAFALADRAGLILNAAAFRANFDFWGKMFNNQSAVPRPRSFYAWTTLEGCIGDLLGSLYVKQYLPPESQVQAFEMTANMKRAFDARLEKVAWMSPATRLKAREKLASMTMNIGFPKKSQDYSGLVVSDRDLYGDVRRSRELAWSRQLERLGRQFDRAYWAFTPQWISYAYTPATNTMEIPAGTFQPPFFDPKADPAVNYGAVGVMIGAMMAAAFDGRGHHYDSNGRLHDWWTPEESQTFERFRRQLSEQYSAVEPLPGIHLKGDLVVDEAIDDLTGWQIALDAYHLSLKGKPAPVIEGLTGDQRVFLGRAQMWRAKFPADFVRNQVATGQNSMPFLRVNGPVRNMDSWYEAFGVQPGNRMYLEPENRVRIW